jgi:DNA primase
MAPQRENTVTEPGAPGSLVRLIASAGVDLRHEGNVWVGKCPFHDDQGESLLVEPATGHWQCDGACQTGGSAAEWVMKAQGLSQALAVEILKSGQSDDTVVSPTGGSHSTVRRLDAPFSSDDDDQRVLHRVIDYYHETLTQSPEVLAYLQKRRIDSTEAIETFKLGFCNRTLGYRLPQKNRKEGGALRGRLQRLGLLRSSGHEHFRGSLVIPIINDGQVCQAYGRKVTPNLRAGTALHLYLPGPQQGIFNLEAVKASDELILCQSLIDALTFWCAGYRNVTCSHGLDGFTEKLLATLRNYAPSRLLIAYRASREGDVAAHTVAERLTEAGIDAYRIEFPNGMDANDHAMHAASPSQALGEVIRKAVWFGNGQRHASPLPESAPENEQDVHSTEFLVESVATSELDDSGAEAPTEDLGAMEGNNVSEETPLPATALPQAPSDIEVDIREKELVLSLEDRRYRIRGFEKNLSYDQLKINLLVSRGEALHVDTFDLYATRPRDAFIKQAALELAVKEEIIKKDLARLLLKLEVLQEQNLREVLTPKTIQQELSEKERAEAMALLTAPNLMQRILDDYQQCGLVGEKTNKLVGYLAALSRKLDRPMAVMVQSTSAAGKSALMEAVLAFIPDEERVQYSAMTGQSLFYMGDIDLRHKILAISEEEGASHAAYALRLLQSEGHLTIASTGKDPFTGKHTTHEYRVEGPVMIFSTTTAIDIDEELLSRCLVLSVDEERTQTQAIHDWQRYQETLEGLLASERRVDILRVHRNAQRLLKPLKVVNPYAERLTFLSDKTRTRRDHGKYLTLIRTIALLHQYQREVKTTYYQGKSLSYVEVTLEDIDMANQIAHEVLGRSLDDMPPQTRHLLTLVDEMVRERCRVEHITRQDCRFSRREVREYAGWGMTQLKVHLQRLEAMEYLLIHKGGRGQRIIYELLYNSEGTDGMPFLMGLIDVEALKQPAAADHWAGNDSSKSATSRPQVGGMSAAGRPFQSGLKPNTGADSEVSEGESTENCILGLPLLVHRTCGVPQGSLGR